MSDTYEISAEGLEALRAEVEELETTARRKIAAEIKTARGHGDLKENAEYHAAKDAQGMLEMRIRQLRDRLDNAVIVTQSGGGTVAFGSVVKVRDEETGKETTYTLVSSLDSNPAEGKLSVDSPVAQALRGSRAGDVATLTTPRGQRKLHILAVS
jgi:transcription elongation factor GreA